MSASCDEQGRDADLCAAGRVELSRGNLERIRHFYVSTGHSVYVLADVMEALTAIRSPGTSRPSRRAIKDQADAKPHVKPPARRRPTVVEADPDELAVAAWRS